MKALMFLAFLAVANAKTFQQPIDPEVEEQVQQNLQFLLTEFNTIQLNPMTRAVEEDANLKVPDLVQKYGYPLESHKLTTSDGYILTIHRIPYGKAGPSPERPVVFVQHGLLSSSADWVISGPEKGLGYMLADRGYDVWMGNFRGNRYSRQHLVHNPDKGKAFWDFSWHEMGMIDLPEMIDLVLASTGQMDLFYIGHSQGTTTFYVMCSERPEYNHKIKAQFSLAPVAYMSHLSSPLLRLIAFWQGGVEFLLKLIGMHEFLPTDGFLHDIAKGFCDEGWLQPLCTNTLFVLAGFNKKQLNTTLLPIVLGHTPAGASTKQILHYGQLTNSGKFRQYDYGLFGNLKRYGSIWAPKYDLGMVKAPVYLMWSNNDWMSAKKDVNKLYKELGNPVGYYQNPDDKWNHLDYLWGIDADILVYEMLFTLMDRH